MRSHGMQKHHGGIGLHVCVFSSTTLSLIVAAMQIAKCTINLLYWSPLLTRRAQQSTRKGSYE